MSRSAMGLPTGGGGARNPNSLANLRRGREPGENVGNDHAVKHGRYAGRYERIEAGVAWIHLTGCKRKGPCGCPVQAVAYDSATKRRVALSFPTIDEAVRWREDMLTEWARQRLRRSSKASIDGVYVQIRQALVDLSVCSSDRRDGRRAVGELRRLLHMAEDAARVAMHEAQ